MNDLSNGCIHEPFGCTAARLKDMTLAPVCIYRYIFFMRFLIYIFFMISFMIYFLGNKVFYSQFFGLIRIEINNVHNIWEFYIKIFLSLFLYFIFYKKEKFKYFIYIFSFYFNVERWREYLYIFSVVFGTI